MPTGDVFVEHLRALAIQPNWHIHELPETITVDVLHVLGDRGWIEVRHWQGRPSRPVRTLPSSEYGKWIWPVEYLPDNSDPPKLTTFRDESLEIRVTEQGTTKLREWAVLAAASEPVTHATTSKRKPGSGMLWQEAKKKAEAYVKRNGYPGFKNLVRDVDCGVGTMVKAITHSTYLKARKAEYEADQKRRPRETPLTGVVLDNTVQTTETDPSSDEAAMLEHLVADQEADKRRDERGARPR